MVPALISGGASLFGGLIGGSSARRAAQISADAQRDAARIAAEEARFRPVGVTTRFGTSTFETNPEGRVTGAGYELSPELRAYQDRLMGLTGGALTQAEEAASLYAPFRGAATGLFEAGQRYITSPADQRLGEIASRYLSSPSQYGLGDVGQRLLSQPMDQQIVDIARQNLQPSQGAQAITSLGQQYLAQSPQEVAQRYVSQQQELLAPTRERQLAQLQNQLYQTGRSGLSVGATGARPSGAAGLGAASPEMEAYYNALAQQDASLAAQAQQAGQQQTQFGAGLLSAGQALGQGQIGFGANLLAGERARELAQIGAGAGLIGQEEALGRAQYGFGADLLGRQLGMEQGRLGFGAGLFGTGGNLLGQMYGGQAAALGPYQAYLGGATNLESLGQQPLSLGIDIGARGQSTGAANALLSGGMGAARTLEASNAYNPFADFLTGFSRNPALVNSAANMFGGRGAVSGFGAGGYGAGVNPFSGEYMGSLEF